MNISTAYLRIEGAFILLTSGYFYERLHISWLWFALFVLSVDVSMVGYLTKNNSFGAHVYNLGHSLTIPLFLGIIGVLMTNTIAQSISLIWIGHIGMDRMLGFGLKSKDGFKFTHLGKIR